MARKKKNKRGSMADKVRNRANKRKGHGSSNSLFALPEGVNQFRPKKKTYRLDILPYEVTVDTHPEVDKGELWHQRTIFVHYNVGPEDGAYVSLKTIDKKCPINDEFRRMKKDPDADPDDVRALKAKERELFNVIDLDDKEAGIQVWEISYHNFGKLLEEEIREDEGDDAATFADLEGGKTLKVRFREGTMGTTTFIEAGKITFKDRKKDYKESILEEVTNLDEILIIPEYDDLQRIFLGLSEDDEDESPKKKKKGKKKKKKEHDEEEDEDDDEEEEDEDDDGDDEEDPDDDDDEEEEDEEEDEEDLDGRSEDEDDDTNESECVACEGTGKSSKGRKCKACDGTGKKDNEDDDDDDDDDDEDDD